MIPTRERGHQEWWCWWCWWLWRGFSDRQRTVGTGFLLPFTPRGGDADRKTNVAVSSVRAQMQSVRFLMRPLIPAWTSHCPVSGQGAFLDPQSIYRDGLVGSVIWSFCKNSCVVPDSGVSSGAPPRRRAPTFPSCQAHNWVGSPGQQRVCARGVDQPSPVGRDTAASSAEQVTDDPPQPAMAPGQANPRRPENSRGKPTRGLPQRAILVTCAISSQPSCRVSGLLRSWSSAIVQSGSRRLTHRLTE